MRRADDSEARRENVQPSLTALAALLIALLPWSIGQGDLYGPEAPRDVAYLRVINAAPGEPLPVAVDGDEWQPLDFAAVSPYSPLDPGQRLVQIAGEEVKLDLGPESFTTIAALAERTLVVEDTPLRDISRGLLTLYNLSADAGISLVTSDGRQVFPEIPPESARSMAISEAEVGLTILRGEEQLAELEPRLYRRGEAHSIIVLPLGSDPQVVYGKAGAEH